MPKRVVVLVSEKVQQHAATLSDDMSQALRLVKPDDVVETNWVGLVPLLPDNRVTAVSKPKNLMGYCHFLWSGTHVLLLIHPDKVWLEVVEAVLRMRAVRKLKLFVATNPQTLKPVKASELRYI